MKKWILSTVLVVFAAALAVVMLPVKQARAACGTVLSGSFLSTAPNQTTANFAVLAGDVVIATAVDSNGTATGIGADININGTFFGAGQTSTGARTTVATAAASGTAYVFFYNNSGTGGTLNWTVTISGPNCPNTVIPSFTDGRKNPDPWATAVLYCINNDMHVYDVNNDSQGSLLFVVTKAEIDELGTPEDNTLLAAANGIRGQVALYRLASGEFQLIAPDTQPGKMYTFIFNGC